MTVIYFLQPVDGGDIKIGSTTSLVTRRREVELKYKLELTVLAVMEGSLSAEFALHRRFSHLRKEDEWFHPGDDLLDFIKSEGSPWDEKTDRAAVATYMTVKIDDELPPLIRMAAANKRISVQEYMSNAINAALQQDLGQGVNRRPAKRGK